MGYANELIPKNSRHIITDQAREIGFIIYSCAIIVSAKVKNMSGFQLCWYDKNMIDVHYGIPSTKSLSLSNRMMAELYKGLSLFPRYLSLHIHVHLLYTSNQYIFL